MLLDGVRRWARRHVGPLASRPELPPAAAELAALVEAARGEGFLGGPQALLGPQAPAGPALAALADLAAESPTAAMHLHGSALAEAVATAAGNAALADSPVVTQGAWGLAGGAWARVLAGRPTRDGDATLLADWLAPAAPRPVVAVADWPGLWWLEAAADGAPVWRWLPRSAFAVRPAGPGHGLDGLTPSLVRLAGDGAAETAPSLTPSPSLLAFHQAALLAVALGAARQALRRAHEYAAVRRQGGRAIVGWPAVQLLLAEAEGALQAAGAALPAGEDWPALTDIMLARAGHGERLLAAAHHAVQIHGGIGYMRDLGVEGRLRDVSHLRLIDGTPTQLRLFVAAWRGWDDDAAPAAGDAIGPDGHLPSGHPLAPRRAFAGLGGLGRLLTQTSPQDLWDRDTARLPRPLRRLRSRWRSFAEQQLAPPALVEDAAAHRGPGQVSPAVAEILRQAARGGYLSDTLPWPLGSAPLCLARVPLALAQAVRAEEFAAACGGMALLLGAHGLGMAPILIAGDQRAIGRFVRPAFRDHRRGIPHLFAFAITEPAAGSDVEDGAGAALLRPGVVARRAAGGWRLSGRKVFISGGDLARTITVFAALEGEGLESWTCFVVHCDMPGFSVVRTELKMGQRVSGAAELHLDEVFVPDSHVVGGLRRGWAINRAVLNYSRAPVGGLAIGMARSAVQAALSFLRRPRAGGRPLLDRQEVQLAVADMLADLAAERALVWQQAAVFVPRQSGAAMAKFHAADAAVRVCERAMELVAEYAVVHGPVEKGFRDARLTQIYEGTNQINRLAMIEDLHDELFAEEAEA